MSASQTRPHLHLTVDEGWINDPLGLTYHGGKYHLFFQYVPGQTEWGPHCHWGHATSDDLLQWSLEAVALAPGEGDDGCWSGCLVALPDEPAAMFYTTVSLDDIQVGRVRVAHPVDANWTSWEKEKGIVAELPAGLEAIAYRDPFVFHDGERWQLLMGAGLADGTATALVHSSEDLQSWRYDGQLASRHTSDIEPLWTGSVWECPQLFPLGDKWVLTVSVWEPAVPHYEAYAVGSYSEGRFTPEHWGRLTYGPSYYAGSTFTDADGRRGLIYWLRGVDDVEGRWASANSIPHVLSLLDGETVVAEPHPNLKARRLAGTALETGIPATVSALVDIDWTLLPAPDAARLSIEDEAGRPVLMLCAQHGELRAETAAGAWTMPLSGAGVRVVIDGPVCELFNDAGVMALPLPPVRTLGVTAGGAGQATAHALASSAHIRPQAQRSEATRIASPSRG
jgi:beta-fructofuranosidase